MLIGYARISTRDQSQALQADALNAAGCEKIFEDTASGAQRDRPGLAAALAYMREGDTLVVWKLDRLARSTRQLIETVEELQKRQIGFRCLTQDIDTTTSGGRLIFTVFAAIAEFEREIIKERTRAGLEAARNRGKTGGRPRSLNEKDLAAARAMLADSALTMEDISARLKVAPATLYRYFPGGRSGQEGVGFEKKPC